MKKNIGFIGAGNMGAAMIKHLVKAEILPAGNIFVNAVQRKKLDLLKSETGVTIVETNEQVVQKSDIVILAVKPNILKLVLEECKNSFDEKKLLITIALGMPIKFYKKILGENRKIVRAMPNTPVMIGEGMTLVSLANNIGTEDYNAAKIFFECFGRVMVIKENLMNAATALTGSSPAYVYMFIEALADAAVRSGIPRDMAYQLVAQAVQGSARMVLETKKHPGELKDHVCSPAGTSIEGVAVLEKNGFRYAIIEATAESIRRTMEIEKIIGNE